MPSWALLELLEDAVRRAGLTTNSTTDDGTPLQLVGTYEGAVFYYDPSLDVVAIRARAQAAAQRAVDDFRTHRRQAVRRLTDEEAQDAEAALMSDGVDPNLAHVVVAIARRGDPSSSGT